MRPTTAPIDNVIEFGVRSCGKYARPDDVLADCSLTKEEKRELLASWASDACAVTSKPSFRTPLGLKLPIEVDEILRALSRLDDKGPRHPPGGTPKRLQTTNRALAA
ncbi:hypothetical protein H8A99_30320 [Bradyrhizobium sp. Arg68]|uniref:hypothetical protein n=1 Tax=Bradyrhizobium ivorense TaxID=2511166 RepID=UPI001E340F1B|nr:hypothetical protein [Bradyrhizobium ivorense]MCC8940624.1 hypothetical protein [Bradyrhizobium ivorense]